MTMAGLMIVSNQASQALARKVAGALDCPYSEMVCRSFADGERYHAFPEDPCGRDLVIIGATCDEGAHQEVMDLIHGGRYHNARSVNVIIPYLGYSTMERVKPGLFEIPKGVTRTRQLFRARPDFVAFVDLHSEAVLHAHGGEVNTSHVWSDELAAAQLRDLGLGDFVLVSPDYGFSKRVARLASLLDCPHTAADKDRYDTDQTIVGQVSSVVKDRVAVVCDDMIRTGGSIVQTAQRCLEAGATEVHVMATHLVLAGPARERLSQGPICSVIGSDSYPGRSSDELLQVYSLAPLLAHVIRSQVPRRR